MNHEILLIAFLLVAYLIEIFRHIAGERAWRAERRDLFARVQAGTLADYKNHIPESVKREVETAPIALPHEYQAAGTFESEIDTSDLAQTQEAFNRVMS
jgi:hypothetical protein